jgi:predicted N-acetyltransferase YhbS
MAQGEGYECELYGRGAESLMFTISNLRDYPQLLSFVSNRTWEAWWKSDGYSAEEIAKGISDIVAAEKFPFVLVAHQRGEYWGHVLGIESDLESRRDLSPWVAALWVDPTHRKKGVATRLLKCAEEQLQLQGHEKIYLCATDEKHNFYGKLGWQIIAQDPTDLTMGIFKKALAPPVS